MLRFCSVLFLATVFISVLWAQDKQFTDDWTRAADSPGSALTLKETGRNGANGRTVVSYRLFASGLPKGQHFTLWTWNLGSEPQAVTPPVYDQTFGIDKCIRHTKKTQST